MDKIDQALTRGVEKIYPSRKALEKVLRSGKKIKLYLGVDPTGGNLHLGHAVPLMKLQEFVDLGHEVIFLVGNFTALCGDPSGHDKVRKKLTPAQIEKNMATYKKQASKVLDFSKVKIKYNAGWLAKLTFKEAIKLASHLTAQQILERSLFQRRLKEKKEIFLHEFFYPLLQGYDSVAMDVDLEIGGTDQTFNMLVGRKLQKIYHQKEKFVLTTKMIPGLDRKQMSKTSGNTINLLDTANNMFGKVMSMADDHMPIYFEMCTQIVLPKNFKTNPMAAKKKLAFEIVKIYHGEPTAREAQAEFEQIFQKRGVPGKMPVFKTKKASWPLIGLLVAAKLAPSRSEAKRLIKQNAVEINSVVVNDIHQKIALKKPIVIRCGKKKFIKII